MPSTSPLDANMPTYRHPTNAEAIRKPQIVKAQAKLASLSADMMAGEWIATCYQAFNIIDVHGSFPMRVLACEGMLELNHISDEVLLRGHRPY